MERLPLRLVYLWMDTARRDLVPARPQPDCLLFAISDGYGGRHRQCHLPGYSPDRGDIDIDNDLLLTMMGNEEMTERLGIPVGEETKLGENGEPHIVGPDP